MIILPYAHERQTVQRLPLVTIGLIVLNIVIFLFTHYGQSSVNDLVQRHEELLKYAFEHPHLEIPEDGMRYFEESQMEHLDTLRAAIRTAEMDQEELRGEQQHLNNLVKELQELEDSNPYQKYGYIPSRGGFVTLITCMFLHGGWMHLLGNLFFLYLAGCSIEDIWGRPLYIGFYTFGGMVATLIHAAKFPGSEQPLVGASGAIAALMGAFLIRLWDTKISFFYWFAIFARGTFKAPAYIMLPLWLLEQLLYASADQKGEFGVAFWAHIGGFVFGALFALGMKQWKVEEKYIAPKIEKKVSLAQNEDFLKGMELSEQGKYPEAMILLHRAVKQEPNHVDAYLEMRRIAEMNHDADEYNRFTGAILEILMRTGEHDLLMEYYHSYAASPLRRALPAKTLFALGGFYEGIHDYPMAAQIYNEIGLNYYQDGLALKAYSKLYHLYFDRLQQREKGTEAFRKAYQHPLATDQWRTAVATDLKRYNIALKELEKPGTVQMPEAAAPSTVTSPSTPSFVRPNPHPAPTAANQPQVPSILSEQAAPLIPPTSVVPGATSVKTDSSPVRELPDASFDHSNGDGWVVVRCKVSKLGLKGLDLQNDQNSSGFLPWNRIRMVSAGRVRIINPATAKPEEDYILADLICTDTSNSGSTITYRLFSHELAYEKIFPRVEQTAEDAFQNLIGIVVNNSRAKCLPNRESCVGPNFPVYPDLSRYDVRAKERISQNKVI